MGAAGGGRGEAQWKWAGGWVGGLVTAGDGKVRGKSMLLSGGLVFRGKTKLPSGACLAGADSWMWQERRDV